MRRFFFLFCCGLVLTGLGCGGASPPSAIQESSGGSGGRRAESAKDAGAGGARHSPGGATGSGGSATTDIDGGNPDAPMPDAPIVTIVSPVSVDDPNEEGVIVTDEVEVVCQTEPANEDSNPVNSSTVRLELIDADGNTVDKPVPGAATGKDGEFSAEFTLTSLPSGPISFRCTASDSSTPPLIGSDEIGTFVDHGPTISVVSPKEDEAFPLIGDVAFEFSVLPDPLAEGDDGASVETVTLKVNGVDIDPVSQGSGTYTQNIDLTDATVFPNTPSGDVPVVIVGANARGVESVRSYSFIVDGTGPTIAITNIKNEAIVGGSVTLDFTVADELSGGSADDVVVEINQTAHRYDPLGQWTRDGDNYSFTFDSRNLAGPPVQVTIDVRAKDQVGNEAEGESLIVYLDNAPPSVDLDPENVRELRLVNNQEVCSESFDPLGESPNDLDVVLPFTRYRALVWDQTNASPGQDVFHFAGTNPESVFIYVQPATATPLLVDTDDDPDNLCDELASKDLLTFLDLHAVSPAGSSYFGSSDSAVSPDPTDMCELGTNGTVPKHLCKDQVSDLTRVIRHGAGDKTPAVYAVGALQSGTTTCTGTGWDFSPLTEVHEGWLCIAVRAVDNVGNVGISRPLRVCYDDDVGDPSPCVVDPSSPPSCTDGCQPPPRFGPAIIRQ